MLFCSLSVKLQHFSFLFLFLFFFLCIIVIEIALAALVLELLASGRKICYHTCLFEEKTISESGECVCACVMPVKAAPSSTRAAAPTSAASLICSHQCNLPLWDDAQIAQENWGSPLAATAPSGNAVDASQDAVRQNSARPRMSASHAGPASAGPETSFEDSAGHRCVTNFIQASHASAAESPSDITDKKMAASSEGAPAAVTWKRPVDIFRPFRPVVHRNATPFVDPYAPEAALTPMEAKPESEACRAPSSAGNAGGSSKKSTAGGPRNAESAAAAAGAAAVTENFHLQYPEAVTVLEDFVGDDVTRWSHCSSVEAVRRYRALPTLMQPYDGALVAGCAETPAEACGSRYSTALRHKLKQAEQLSALPEAPPFLMTALDSALLAVEQAQRYIPAGSYLWELVYPHAPGTCHPVYNPFGKYAVKLFVAGAFRKVVVDDRLPVDVLGRPLLTTTSLKELWPALIGKAVIKALGPVTGVQALAASPDLIVSVLLGNWVPQYLSPRDATVSTMTALLLYERQLRRSSMLSVPLLPDAAIPPSTKTGDSTSEDAEGGSKKEARSAASGDGGGAGRNAGARRRSSAQQSRGDATAVDKAPTEPPPQQQQQRLFASEYCSATGDEPIPTQSMYVCGLRSVAVTHTCGPASATAAHQLFTIHAMQPFRNTFALLLHTTPRLPLAEGIFEKEKDADDVSALRRWGQHYQAAGGYTVLRASSFSGGDCAADLSANAATEMVAIDSVRSASVTSCWLTLEEFMAEMDQVVAWRVLEGRFAHATPVIGEAVLQFNGLGATGDVADAAVVAPTAKQSTGAGGAKSVSSPRDEAAPLVASAVSTTSPAQVGMNGTRGAAAPHDALYPSTLSPTCVWWKLVAATAAEAVVVVSCPTLAEALPTVLLADSPADRVDNAPLHSSSSSHDAAAATRERRVDLHQFQWDRAEPLNHIASIDYIDGALKSTVLRFCPGTHVLRVDLHNLQPADTFAFLSDAEMEVQLSLAYDVAQDGFATVTDAGAYPAIASHNVEYIWLKRVFTLTKPTCLTVVLSTLDTAEDVAAHRRVNTATQRATVAPAAAAAMPMGKAAHGKGGASANTRGGGGNGGNTTPAAVTAASQKNSSADASEADKGQPSPPPQQPQQQQQQRTASASASNVQVEPLSVALLRYTTLTLVNLDHPEEYHVGRGGRLVQLRLEPNENGYLILAYTSVPAAAQVREAAVCGRDPVAEEVAPDGIFAQSASLDAPTAPTAPTATATAAPTTTVFPAGQWKLTLRSDAELLAFDAVEHDVHEVQVEADLPHGGSPVLFRRICTVAEPTHLSLCANLRTPLAMAYTVRITRPGAAAPPVELPSLSAPVATTKSAGNTNTTVSPPGASESPSPADDVPANVLTVFESEATEGRLFVADVFLPCASNAVTRAPKAGGGGGSGTASAAPTAYIVEAFVAQASATAWNDQCRHRQETVFAQVRDNAEARAAAQRESVLDDFRQDPEGFLQRRREMMLQRRQQLIESAEKTVAHAQVDASAADMRGVRGRSSSSSRRQSHRVSNALDTFVKDSVRRQSSSLAEDAAGDAATLAPLDAVDPASLVHLSAQLSFSSSKVELKEETAAPDPVAELRLHMKETMAWLQERTGCGNSASTSGGGGGIGVLGSSAPTASGANAGAVGSSPGGGASSQPAAASMLSGNAKSQTPRTQKDSAAAAALSAEDALRAKMARQSRLAYLRNPQHIFLPSFEGADAVRCESVATTAGVAAGVTPAAGSLGNAKTKPSHDLGGSGSGGHITGAPLSSSLARGVHKESVVASTVPSFGIASADAFSSSSPVGQRGPEVVLYDGAATHFRYAAPLTPSQYRVELLPLRSYEESTSAAVGREKDGGGGGGGSGGPANNKRAKAPMAGGTAAAAGASKGAAAGSTATSGSGAASATAAAVGAGATAGEAGPGAVSIVGSSTLSCPLTTAECDASVRPLQAPLFETMKAWDPAVATTRPQKAEHHASFRASYQSFFEAIAAGKASSAAPSGSADGVDTAAQPVVYHSLLGMKEEDVAMALKSKKPTAVV